MKKAILFLFFSFALISSGAFSQNIQISDTSNHVVTGTTIDVYSSNINIDIMDVNLRVKNTSDQELRLYVRRVINSEVDSSSNAFCFGIQCYASTTDTSTEAVVLGAGIDTTFLGDYYPSLQSGLTSITYEFFEGAGHKTATAQVTVNFLLSPLGLVSDLNNYEFSGAFPNPASSSTSFNFSFPAGTNGNIVVRNLLGSVVRNVKLERPQGRSTIFTNDLKEGVYFYSLILDNKAVVTKKLVIRH